MRLRNLYTTKLGCIDCSYNTYLENDKQFAMRRLLYVILTFINYVTFSRTQI